MRLLILGGTGWLGGELATTAIRDGHQVTCLARGTSGAVPAGATFVKGDRDDADGLAAVTADRWDAVLDVSRQPGQVRRAVAELTTDSYVFVSSGSVYSDHSTPNQDESGPLLTALDGDVMESMATYGEAKVAAEQHVEAAFGDRALIARVGLIGGPGDITDRTGYWPLRFACPSTVDGRVLTPDDDGGVQIIDVRDLAQWLVDSAGHRGGTFNVTGESVPLSTVLQMARKVAAHTGPVAAADTDWLLAHDIEPWAGPRSLPLWLGGDPDWAGFGSRDSSRARAAGLRARPLKDTFADTLAWELTRDRTEPRLAGLTDADERALLEQLR